MKVMRTDIEVLRIVAAFGVVWFHSGISYGRDVAYSGLVLFLIFAAFFAIRSSRPNSIVQRIKKLIIPCLIWSLIYAGFKFAVGWNVFSSEPSMLGKILSTPSIHLWFLPFLFFCLLAIDVTKRTIPITVIAITSVLLASLMLVSAEYWREFDYTSPAGQYMHALPAVFIGIYFGCYGSLSKEYRIFLTLLLTVAVAITALLNISDFSITYLVGFAASLLLIVNNSALKDNRFVLKLSSLTFGIYLIHVLVLYILRHIGIDGLLLPTMAFIASAVIVYVVSILLPKSLVSYVF